MAKRTKQRKLLSEQLRDIILNGPLTRYRIAKDSSIDQGQLHKFCKGTARLTTDSLDRIGETLRLRFLQDDE